MKQLKGNVLYGQSGGPTSVINASAYGIIKEGMKQSDVIDEVIIMKNGIKGALNEEFYFMKDQDEEEIELLKHTPGSAFGSIRYKLAHYEEDESDYIHLLYIFKKYNIRYFFYNGGNDSMDTCSKIAEYMKHVEYDINVIGIPKTIDNDLLYTDHTPGFGSAAKYIANTIMEIKSDLMVYPKGRVTIVEIMGRHTGWLTAASCIGEINGFGPDLIYLPEVPFSIEQFKEDVQRVYDEKQNCLVAVSEGIRSKEGVLLGSSLAIKDAFGHFQLCGVGQKLASIVESEMPMASRSIELGTATRAASHLHSLTDVEEAIRVGEKALQFAINGTTNAMITINRISNSPYQVEYGTKPLHEIANKEKKMPLSMINKKHNGITDEYFTYVLPLINGENTPVYENGMQRFTRLKK